MPEAGIGALGLDARALLWQVVNFALLLGLLRLFAYKPVLKILETRRRKVEESLRTADELAAAQVALEQRVKAVERAAQAQAQQLLRASEQRAKAIMATAEQAAHEKATEILKQAEAKLQQEVVMVRQELKHETLQLVALATEKLLGEKLDAAQDERLIKAAVAAVEAERA